MNKVYTTPIISKPDPLVQSLALLGQAMPDVEATLIETTSSSVELIPEISNHLIVSGGKRIRPCLLLLFEKACGNFGKARGVPLAVATELMHSATLLHDDVVDRGHLRRGVPSAPRVYGNAASVLVGDFLLARAFDIVVEHGDQILLSELAKVFTAMAEGEMLQLIRSGRVAISLPDYVEIISSKTAGLFSWCCRAGAALGDGNADGNRARRAAEFGKNFGMAFQIIDDVLDYTASPDQSGKDLANDLLQGKTTLPLLLACEEDAALLPLLEQVAAQGPDELSCHTIVQRVLGTKAIARAQKAACSYSAKARSCLESLPGYPDSPTVNCLLALTQHIVDRTESTVQSVSR
jgi:octaprenyl-diphosphate synthase